MNRDAEKEKAYGHAVFIIIVIIIAFVGTMTVLFFNEFNEQIQQPDFFPPSTILRGVF